MSFPQHEIGRLLRERFGEWEFSLDTPWQTSMALVLHHGKKNAPRQEDWTWLGESPLGTPQEVRKLSVGVIGRLLESRKLPARNAGVILKLAEWWGPGSESDIPSPLRGTAGQTLSLEEKAEIRQATKLSLELVDQLLLMAADQRAVPLGRGTQRIVCRHGWLDLQTGYDDWQAWLCATGEVPSLRSLWHGLSRTATEFCGPSPRCDGCPLESLLPPGGPVSLDQD